jgi:hypothetical protein
MTTTEPTPSAGRSTAGRAGRRRPAATARVVAAGLSATSTLGVLAYLGATAPASVSADSNEVALGDAADPVGVGSDLIADTVGVTSRSDASPPTTIVVRRHIFVPGDSGATAASASGTTGSSGGSRTSVGASAEPARTQVRAATPARRTTPSRPTTRSRSSR